MKQTLNNAIGQCNRGPNNTSGTGVRRWIRPRPALTTSQTHRKTVTVMGLTTGKEICLGSSGNSEERGLKEVLVTTTEKVLENHQLDGGSKGHCSVLPLRNQISCQPQSLRPVSGRLEQGQGNSGEDFAFLSAGTIVTQTKVCLPFLSLLPGLFQLQFLLI